MHHSALPPLIQRFFDERGAVWAPKTRDKAELCMRRMMEFLSEKDYDLDRNALVQYRLHLLKTVATSTAFLHFRYVSAFCNFLYEERLLDREIHRKLGIRVPVKTIKVPSISFMRYWRVINRYCPVTSHIFTLAYHTGMAITDCVHLRWSEVDFTSGVISRLRGKTGVECIIPFHNSHLYDHLLALYHKRLTEMSRTRLENPEYTDSLVSQEALRYYNQSTTLQTKLRRALKSANLPLIRFHDLRRMFISRLLEAGVNPVIISRMTGHSSLEMIQRYATVTEATIIQFFDEAKAKVPDDPDRVAGPVSSKVLSPRRSYGYVKRATSPADPGGVRSQVRTDRPDGSHPVPPDDMEGG